MQKKERYVHICMYALRIATCIYCMYICVDIIMCMYVCSLFTFSVQNMHICDYYLLHSRIFNYKQYLNFSELLQLLKFVLLLIYFMGNFRCYKTHNTVYICMYVCTYHISVHYTRVSTHTCYLHPFTY